MTHRPTTPTDETRTTRTTPEADAAASVPAGGPAAPTPPDRPAREPLWSRDLVLASIANLALAFVFYMLMTTMALYAVERFGASDGTGGLAASTFVIGAVVSRLFAGNLADLVGRRRVLVVAMAVHIAASVAYLPVDGAADGLGALLAVRAVHGAAFGVASTAAMALAQSLIPLSRRAEGTGYFTLSTTLATAVGPLLGLSLAHAAGYRALFVAASIAAVLGMAVALGIRTPDARPAPDHRARLRRFHPRDMLHRDVVPVASVMLLLGVAYSGVLAFLTSFAEHEGLGTGASLFFVVYAAVLFVARLFSGRLQDERGDNLVVLVAAAAFVVGMVLLAVASSDLVLVLAGAFMGLGFGTLMSALQTIAVARVPMPRVGVAISTHFFMLDLGVGLGPVALGLALPALGYGGMYLVLAGVVVLATVVYELVHGRHQRRRTARGEATPA